MAVTGAVLFVLVGVVASAQPAHAQYTPVECAFIITPSSATAGETVTITGQGFPPNQTFTFAVNGIAFATGTSDAAGTITATGTVPSSVGSGTFNITVDCGGILATQSINVTAASSNGNTGSTSGSLASTGLDVMPFVKAALLLLGVGGLLLLTARRREHSHS
jgi:hypothetical protein